MENEGLYEEYRIVIQQGGGKPYSLWTFKSFNECYAQLIELIQNQTKNVKKEYYVTNDFFKNEFQPFYNGITKYTIQKRKVNEWETYTKSKEEKAQKEKSNIISFRKIG